MNNNRKALLLLMCAVLVVATSVFGTLAYLTDTEAVTNTFTVGSVGIQLDEAHVNQQGQPLKNNAVVEEVKNADRWQPTTEDTEQEYHLLPGHTYIKDPTVTVAKGSEESYIRMMVTVSFESALADAQLATDLDEIFAGYDAKKWIRKDKTVSDDRKTLTYEYRYHTTEDGKNDAGTDVEQKLEPLFTAIQVPGEYTKEQIAFLGGMKINITAHAIQADGFANADAAWAAFNAQTTTNT